MGNPPTVSAFSFSSKTYIHETQMKIKDLLYRDVEIGVGFEKELDLIERKLGLLLDFSKHVEESNAAFGSVQASEEEIRARKRYLDYEFGIAVNMCHVVDYFILRRNTRVFDDLADFLKYEEEKEEEIKWFKTQMDDFTKTASSFGIGKIFLNQDLYGEPITLSPSRNFKYGKEEERHTVVGLEVDEQLLSQLLVREMEKVIWIVGAKGIGKTTLAMKVYENIIVSHHFQFRAWLTVSEEFGPRDLLENLVRKIPVQYLSRMKYSTDSTKELENELLHVLRSVRCLIVLDGLQTNRTLQDLSGILTSLDGESRIMITTQSMELAKSEKYLDYAIHKMMTLGDQEAWELFNAKVRVPIQLEKLGIELVRKCMGNPLHILALGNILSRRAVTEDQWLKVLNQVFDQNQVSVFNELEAAVDSLPSHLKDCLSSFELFNDDFDIPMRRLIVYWVAEGHVQQEVGSKKPPEVLAEKQLMEFIRLNMIQVAKWKLNGRIKTCRMNYFLRDNWLPKVKKDKSVYDKKKDASSKSSSGTGMIIRLADHLDIKEKCFSHIHGNRKISHSSFKKYYGDLGSLVSFDSREGPVPGEAIGNFLRRGIAGRCFKILRVLDLEGVFRPNLPELIRKLLQLRYLGLRRTYIEGLPSTIGKLLNLQTLDLKHTCIRSLPCSVWEMQQLRHIYLSESYRSRIVAPPRNRSLVDFQTLWGAFVDEETPVVDGLDRLINLRKLGLVCRLIISQQKELAEWISKLEHLESLRLRSINEMVLPSNLYLKSLSSLYNLSSIYLLGRLENPEFLNALPTSLTEITLSSSELVEDPMKELEKLPNLRILNLYACSYTGKTMVCSSWGFPLLRVLNLWKLEELEEWTVEEGALAIIRDLEIRSCNKFKKIPDGLIHLGGCRELKLTNMPDEFKARVIANQGQDWYKIAHVPSVIIKN